VNVLKAGTEITCPNCEALIARVAADIHSGEPLTIAKFDFIQDGHVKNAPMRCKDCFAPFGRHAPGSLYSQIHTKDGWL
jgi:hypothetical protein